MGELSFELFNLLESSIEFLEVSSRRARGELVEQIVKGSLSRIEETLLGLSEQVGIFVLEESSEVISNLLGRRVFTTQVIAKSFTGEGEVTPLHNLGEIGQVLDNSELSFEGVVRNISVSISVFQPVDREQITQAGTDVLTTDDGIRTTISSPRGFSGVSSRDGIDVEVGRQTLEHGTRFASFQVVN